MIFKVKLNKDTCAHIQDIFISFCEINLNKKYFNRFIYNILSSNKILSITPLKFFSEIIEYNPYTINCYIQNNRKNKLFCVIKELKSIKKIKEKNNNYISYDWIPNNEITNIDVNANLNFTTSASSYYGYNRTIANIYPPTNLEPLEVEIYEDELFE